MLRLNAQSKSCWPNQAAEDILDSVTPYLPSCSVPLLFESDLDECPYGTVGTGFLVRNLHHYYFITAAHCLQDGDHERLRVPYAFGNRDVITLKSFGCAKAPPGEDDTDYADIAVFLIPENFYPVKGGNSVEPVSLSYCDSRDLLISKMILTVRGFPKEAPESEIDYENKYIKSQPLLVDANYQGKSQKFCHRLQFVNHCPITDFNGMSGSPVFAKLPYYKRIHYVIVGMLLRASGSNRYGHFVSIEVVKEVIRRIEMGCIITT